METMIKGMAVCSHLCSPRAHTEEHSPTTRPNTIVLPFSSAIATDFVSFHVVPQLCDSSIFNTERPQVARGQPKMLRPAPGFHITEETAHEQNADLRSSEEGLRQHRPPAQLHEATEQAEDPALHGSDTASANLRGPCMVPSDLQVRPEKTARSPERMSPASDWVALVREEHRRQSIVQRPHHQELRGRSNYETRRNRSVFTVGTSPRTQCPGGLPTSSSNGTLDDYDYNYYTLRHYTTPLTSSETY
ncbi:hypothetical protein J6590_055500 [Homalodisca vitripennis]|nr:hypothetical protein J6590_055500 [Homalodisca vitripennis]